MNKGKGSWYSYIQFKEILILNISFSKETQWVSNHHELMWSKSSQRLFSQKDIKSFFSLFLKENQTHEKKQKT